jgi:hypothetical protein
MSSSERIGSLGIQDSRPVAWLLDDDIDYAIDALFKCRVDLAFQLVVLPITSLIGEAAG